PPGQVRIKKAVNAAFPLSPTPLEDANDPNNPRPLPVGMNLVWTYLVTNAGTTPLSITSIRDDNGTPTNTADDFTPVRLGGDTNNNNLLDPGEVWLYTSAGFTRTVQPGFYGNLATVVSVNGGTASDPAYIVGVPPPPPPTGTVRIQKAVNAANPLS